MIGTKFHRTCFSICKIKSMDTSYRPSLQRWSKITLNNQLCRPTYTHLCSTIRATPVVHNKLARSYSNAAEENKMTELEKFKSEMNIRLANENGFLSWCRNAYLSTVVGVAMITEGTTELAMDAGLSALLIAFLNIFWGTGSYITNLIRLRNVSGMSSVMLAVNIIGSSLHCLIWFFVIICYLGFLDENAPIDVVPFPTSRKNRNRKEL